MTEKAKSHVIKDKAYWVEFSDMDVVCIGSPFADKDKTIQCASEEDALDDMKNMDLGGMSIEIFVCKHAHTIRKALQRPEVKEVSVKELGKDIERWKFDDEIEDCYFGDYLASKYPDGLKIVEVK